MVKKDEVIDISESEISSDNDEQQEKYQRRRRNNKTNSKELTNKKR